MAVPLALDHLVDAVVVGGQSDLLFDPHFAGFQSGVEALNLRLECGDALVFGVHNHGNQRLAKPRVNGNSA